MDIVLNWNHSEVRNAKEVEREASLSMFNSESKSDGHCKSNLLLIFAIPVLHNSISEYHGPFFLSDLHRFVIMSILVIIRTHVQ